MLDCAVQLDMPQLLACCEHFLAVDLLGQVDKAALAEHLPGQSLLRIAKGSCNAFQSMRAEVSKHASVRNSECTVFVYMAQKFGDIRHTGSCLACDKFAASMEDISKYVPTPKQFLRMAQGLSV